MFNSYKQAEMCVSQCTLLVEIDSRENESQCYVFDFYLTMIISIAELISIYTFYNIIMTSSKGVTDAITTKIENTKSFIQIGILLILS